MNLLHPYWRSRLAWLAILAGATVLVGCASTIDRQAINSQSAPLPFAVADDYGQVSDNLNSAGRIHSLQGWIHASGDRALISLMDLAIQNNATINRARANLSKLEAIRVSAGQNLLPKLNVGVSGSEVRRDNGVDTPRSYVSSVGVSWELDLFGKNINTYQAKSFAALSGEWQMHHAQQVVLAQLVRNWVTANGAALRLALAEQNLHTLEQKQKIIGLRYQGGNGEIDALAQIESERIQLQTTVRNLGYAESSAIRQIQTLIGQYPNGQRAGVMDATTLPAARSDLKVNPPASLLSNRPDVAASFVQLLASRADVAAAVKAKWLPTLSFSATGTTTASLFGDILASPNVWSLGVNFLKNLFSNQEAQALTLAREDEAIALVNYLETVGKAFEEAENTLHQETVAAHLHHANIRALALADKLFQLADNRYSQGLIDAELWIERRRAFFLAEQQSISAQENWLNAQVGVLLALGIPVESSAAQH